MRKGWVNGVNDFCLPLEKYSRELDRDEKFSILYELQCAHLQKRTLRCRRMAL